MHARKYQREANAIAQQLKAGVDLAHSNRIYLEVPYSERLEAKSRGARWDPKRRQWYVSKGIDLSVVEKWLKPAPVAQRPRPRTGHVGDKRSNG